MTAPETIREELRRRKTDRAKAEAVFCVNCRHYEADVEYSYKGTKLTAEHGCMAVAKRVGDLDFVTGTPITIATDVRNCGVWNDKGDCSYYEAKESK